LGRVEGERRFALGKGYNAGEGETKTTWQANATGEERPASEGRALQRLRGVWLDWEVIHFSRDWETSVERRVWLD